MTFEFLVVCRMGNEVDLRKVLSEALSIALEDNLNEFELEEIEKMITVRFRRDGDQMKTDVGKRASTVYIGFGLELPDETLSPDIVIDEFTEALPNTPPIFHVLKFEDFLLRAELTMRAAEIYSLEMKLRRVLSLIYLNAYQDEDPYDLLRDETVKPYGKDQPGAQQMRTAAENQFFYLTFSQYIGLNQRLGINLSSMLAIVRAAEQYDTFRQEILRVPVEHENDAVLLAGLKDRMDAIERMRNCVAHNRRPTKSISENYVNARPLLEQMLDDYLASWQAPPNFNV